MGRGLAPIVALPLGPASALALAKLSALDYAHRLGRMWGLKMVLMLDKTSVTKSGMKLWNTSETMLAPQWAPMTAKMSDPKLAWVSAAVETASETSVPMSALLGPALVHLSALMSARSLGKH